MALWLIPVGIIGAIGWMIANARAMPVVRRLEVVLPFPADAARDPVRVALLTDTHLSGPDNSPARMARIVDQINALKPDLILLGGDYVGDTKGGANYDAYASIEPFGRLWAPLGVVAVLGNHDKRSKVNLAALDRPSWRAAFADLGIEMLDNEAVRRGPIAIGGLRDIYTGKPDIRATMAAMKRLGGAPVMLTHGPDPFPKLPDTAMLTLAGHTHCGQVALPWWGAVYTTSDYGTRYACGVYREGKRVMVVSAGVGTSALPIRAFAPPDIWIITIKPQ